VQDGIHLPKAETRHPKRNRQVARIIRTAPAALSSELTLGDALKQIRSAEFRTCLVTDQRGLVGVISLQTLARDAAERGDQQKLSELMNGLAFPHVHSDQGLEVALDRMGANQLEILPVVSRADVHKLEGIVTLRDVLDSYSISPLQTMTERQP